MSAKFLFALRREVSADLGGFTATSAGAAPTFLFALRREVSADESFQRHRDGAVRFYSH